jgi:hypothetical protein
MRAMLLVLAKEFAALKEYQDEHAGQLSSFMHATLQCTLGVDVMLHQVVDCNLLSMHVRVACITAQPV